MVGKFNSLMSRNSPLHRALVRRIERCFGQYWRSLWNIFLRRCIKASLFKSASDFKAKYENRTEKDFNSGNKILKHYLVGPFLWTGRAVVSHCTLYVPSCPNRYDRLHRKSDLLFLKFLILNVFEDVLGQIEQIMTCKCGHIAHISVEYLMLIELNIVLNL